MGTPSYMRSVVERNIVLRPIPIFEVPIPHTIRHTHTHTHTAEVLCRSDQLFAYTAHNEQKKTNIHGLGIGNRTIKCEHTENKQKDRRMTDRHDEVNRCFSLLT